MLLLEKYSNKNVSLRLYFFFLYNQNIVLTYKRPADIHSQSLFITPFPILRVHIHGTSILPGRLSSYGQMQHLISHWNKNQVNIKVKYMLFKMSYLKRSRPLIVFISPFCAYLTITGSSP